jgi:bifunctional N-acetylglucosamine-1-phosphate-uridyltransferase/glucosamine-1-phosphate-acetyltransferase GlmU-like protein
VIRSKDGAFLRIVEEKDCTEDERAVREVNSGVYVFRACALLPALERLGRCNAQGEYYLTDAPAYILEDGGNVGAVCACSGFELLGVNTPEQLIKVESLLKNNGRRL